MFVLGVIVSVGAMCFGWLLGYGTGYTLGMAHGREAETVPITRKAETSLNVADLDTLRRSMGLNVTRAQALERM